MLRKPERVQFELHLATSEKKMFNLNRNPTDVTNLAVQNCGHTMFNLNGTCLGSEATAAPCPNRPNHVQLEWEADVMNHAVRNRGHGVFNLNGTWQGLGPLPPRHIQPLPRVLNVEPPTTAIQAEQHLWEIQFVEPSFKFPPCE